MRLQSKASQKKLRRQGSVLHSIDNERGSDIGSDIGNERGSDSLSVTTDGSRLSTLSNPNRANDKLSPTSSIAAMSSSEGFDK